MPTLDIVFTGILLGLAAVVVYGIIQFMRQPGQPLLGRAESALSRIERFAIGLLTLYALLQSVYESINRYFMPQLTTDWGLDLVIFALMWAVFVAGSGLVRDGRHIRADLLIRTFPPNVQRACEIFNAVIGILFCGLFTYFGFKTVTFAYNLNEVTEASLQFPVWIYYLGLPVGLFLMTIRYLIRLKIYVFEWDEESMALRLDQVEAHD